VVKEASNSKHNNLKKVQIIKFDPKNRAFLQGKDGHKTASTPQNNVKMESASPQKVSPKSKAPLKFIYPGLASQSGLGARINVVASKEKTTPRKVPISPQTRTVLVSPNIAKPPVLLDSRGIKISTLSQATSQSVKFAKTHIVQEKTEVPLIKIEATTEVEGRKTNVENEFKAMETSYAKTPQGD